MTPARRSVAASALSHEAKAWATAAPATPASALAAGQVPVHVSVATPSGHEVTAPATLRVKVRPTGASIYWVIGGAAALLLAGGTWRTVRGGRRARAAAPETTDPEGT